MNNEYIDYTAATARVYHKQLDWGNKVLMVTPAGDALYQYRQNEDPTPVAFYVVIIGGKGNLPMVDPDDGTHYLYVPYTAFLRFEEPEYLDIIASKYYCINPVLIGWMYEVMKLVDYIACHRYSKILPRAFEDLTKLYYEAHDLELIDDNFYAKAAQFTRAYEAFRDFNRGVTWKNAMIPSDRKFIHDIAKGKYGSDTRIFLKVLMEKAIEVHAADFVDSCKITRSGNKDLTYWLTELNAKIEQFLKQE